METIHRRELAQSIETSWVDRPILDVAYFQIYGLNCPSCVERVRMALRLAPGVTQVIVEYPDGLAEVTYDPKKITVDALALAVQAAGDGDHHRYRAEPL